MKVIHFSMLIKMNFVRNKKLLIVRIRLRYKTVIIFIILRKMTHQRNKNLLLKTRWKFKIVILFSMSIEINIIISL